jgi:hypothetical protein
MYACSSHQPNRSVPADHRSSSSSSSSYWALATPLALAPRTEATTPAVNIFYPGLGLLKTNRHAGMEEFGCCPADSQREIKRRLLAAGTPIRGRSAIAIDATNPLLQVGSNNPRRIPSLRLSEVQTSEMVEDFNIYSTCDAKKNPSGRR